MKTQKAVGMWAVWDEILRVSSHLVYCN